MCRLNLGIIGCSEIAYRRFLPALKKSNYFNYVGIASRNIDKTNRFIDEYGGKGYRSYEEIIDDENIDALYIPLPPALHYEWAKKALEKGKHILLEKPFTINQQDTFKLIELAEQKDIALFENYMFKYHSQLQVIKNMIMSGDIGDVRGYKISFGFPMRGNEDFRYNKELGGGALLDCGGYTIKLASILLGESAKVVCSKLNYSKEFDVDIFGSATLQNNDGITAQVAFGMDNAYKCEVEVWGSTANITAMRIFTAGNDLAPELIVRTSSDTSVIKLSEDDQFLNAINDFYKCIIDRKHRNHIFEEIKIQAININQIIINN